jgi:hypothetical protein
MRGSKKVFIDMYFLLKKISLVELFKLMEKKYRDVDYSKPHLLKSLVYFDDAQGQPMPRMHKEISWEEVKGEIVEKVRKVEL